MPKIVVTEEQWIQTGMESFAQGGIEQLVIEQMAVRLGCSKSSFYWYFKDRNTYVRRIVEAWRERTTSQVIATSTVRSTADERIMDLLFQMFSQTQRGDFLFYLRKLSGKEEEYRSILDEIERMRIEYMKQLLVQKGVDMEKAYRKSWLLYHYYLGWYERHKQEPLSEESVRKHIGMLWTEWISN